VEDLLAIMYEGKVEEY